MAAAVSDAVANAATIAIFASSLFFLV